MPDEQRLNAKTKQKKGGPRIARCEGDRKRCIQAVWKILAANHMNLASEVIEARIMDAYDAATNSMAGRLAESIQVSAGHVKAIRGLREDKKVLQERIAFRLESSGDEESRIKTPKNKRRRGRPFGTGKAKKSTAKS